MLGVASLALALAIPQAFPEKYFLYLLTTSYIFAIYAIGWNMLASSGQVSLGHAAFYGLGAYSSTLIAMWTKVPAVMAVLAGPLLASLAGLLVGVLCIRLREWLLAMVTFGFAVIIQTFMVDDQLRWLTNGWDGLFPPSLLPTNLDPYPHNYYIILVAVVIIYLVSRWLFNSRIGLAFRAIHENELLARTCGIKIRRYKLMAFFMSGYISGIAGALQSFVIFRFVSPEIFHLQNSLWPLIFSVGGGLGTVQGPLIGSILIWLSWESFRSITGFYGLIGLGTLLGLVVIFLPQGFVSVAKRGDALLKTLISKHLPKQQE